MQCPVDGCDFESDSKRGIASHCGQSHPVEENPYRIKCECNYCGDEFTKSKQEYEKWGGQYCSMDCRSEDGTVECECNYCGDEFTIIKANYKNGKGKYCSKECKSKDKTINCECNYCGDRFEIYKSDYKQGVGKYCSIECKSKDNTVNCKCNFCGNKFTIPKSHYDKGEGKHCSKGCHNMSMRSSNPDLRNSPEYRQFRETVLERDNHRCVECGDDADLHVHHITPIYEDESLATDVDNGQTLCVECHAVAHEELGDDDLAALIRSKADDAFEIAVTV